MGKLRPRFTVGAEPWLGWELETWPLRARNFPLRASEPFTCTLAICSVPTVGGRVG